MAKLSLSLAQNAKGRERYSPRERALFSILLGFRGRCDTVRLAQKYWDGDKIPVNGRIAVGGAMRSLQMKVERNGEPFRIHRSERCGPKPLEYWIEQQRR